VNANRPILAALLALLTLPPLLPFAYAPEARADDVTLSPKPGSGTLALPVGRLLTEIDPGDGSRTTLRAIHAGEVLWEVESRPEDAQLGPTLERFPVDECRAVLVSGVSRAGVNQEALAVACPGLDVLTTFSLGFTPLAMEQQRGGWILHVDDWAFAGYSLGPGKKLSRAAALPLTRVLRFDPAVGWRPERPGEFSRLHEFLGEQFESTPPDAEEELRAAGAIAATAHAYMATGSRENAEVTLARMLPASWMPQRERVLADVLRACRTFSPARNHVFRH
jgi:hypothetical protein